MLCLSVRISKTAETFKDHSGHLFIFPIFYLINSEILDECQIIHNSNLLMITYHISHNLEAQYYY